MRISDWITVVALVVGPALAVGLQLVVSWRARIRGPRVAILQSLLAYRTDPFNAERVKALCLIDLVFHNVPAVRDKWKEYHRVLNDPNVFKQHNFSETLMNSQNAMIAEMAKHLGYGKEIGIQEIARTYAPKQYELDTNAQRLLRDEMTRVFVASEHFGNARRESNQG